MISSRSMLESCYTYRLNDKLKRYAMRLIRLFIEVKNRDPSVLGGHVQFFIWNRFRVQRHEVGDPCHAIFFTQLLVKLAVMGFINSEPGSKIVVKIGFLLQRGDDIAHSTGFGNKDVKCLLSHSKKIECDMPKNLTSLVSPSVTTIILTLFLVSSSLRLISMIS